jgi:hypothetical protein
MPPLSFYEGHLGEVEITPLPVPRDCSDGFLYAYWARPQAYLDPRLRQGSSSFWALSDAEAGLARLETDLASGAWSRRYAGLVHLDELDCGYRLVVSVGSAKAM